MLARIRRFIRDQRSWRSEQAAAWAEAGTAGRDGFSPFQQECERRIAATLSSRGLSLRGRRVEDESERFIVAEVPALSATIWIYLDQTDIRTPTRELRLERWDTRTPEEHHARVVEFLSELPRVEGP